MWAIFSMTQEAIFKPLAEKLFMRLNNKIVTGRTEEWLPSLPVESWGWLVFLSHSPDGHTFRPDLFTTFKLLWKSFLTGPVSGKLPSNAVTHITEDSWLPCHKRDLWELFVESLFLPLLLDCFRCSFVLMSGFNYWLLELLCPQVQKARGAFLPGTALSQQQTSSRTGQPSSLALR